MTILYVCTYKYMHIIYIYVYVYIYMQSVHTVIHDYHMS